MQCKLLPRILAVVGLLTLLGCGSSSTSSTPASSGAAAAQQPAAAPAPPPKPMVIADGTVIAVTVDQSISSETNNLGDHFAASLAEPVLVDGKQVIPQGAKVSGTVTLAKSAGRFRGNAELGLSLDSIAVNGRTYDVKTAVVSETRSGRGKRTAIGAGAGAAVGAVIGAIAGGGKGAAIGGATGAGAGTAGAALTGSRDITIPPETTLHFRLTAPLSIESK